MDKQRISEILLKLRGDKSREQVSYELGISFNSLRSYESGERIPKDDVKIRIANYYNVSVAYIFFNQSLT